MTYTATEVVTILSALGVLIAAVGVATVNVVVALRTTRKVEETGKKTDEIAVAVERVHVLTNNNLNVVKEELRASRVREDHQAEQIAALLAVVTDLRGEREKAQVQAALLTPVPRTGTEDRRETKQQIDRIEAIVTSGTDQIDVIDETTTRIDATVNPPPKKGR